MSIRFLIDLAFVITFLFGAAKLSVVGVKKVYNYVQLESLTAVQKGHPKLEDFTRRLTKKTLKL